VTISNVTPSDLNGTYTITTVNSPTGFVYTQNATTNEAGSGGDANLAVALDICPVPYSSGASENGRGVVLRDFLLENGTATTAAFGNIGIRINCNGEPKFENIYVWNYDSGGPGAFSAAGIVVGDIFGDLVNDFLCRDCYVRQQGSGTTGDGLQLLNVSEATIDHSRFTFNYGVAIRLGFQPMTGCALHYLCQTSNNIQIVNGTGVGTMTINPAILVTDAENILNIDNLYCETTASAGAYCIDATNELGSNPPLLNITGGYFAYTGSGSAAAAVGVNNAAIQVSFIGNTCINFSTACFNILSSPQVVDINNHNLSTPSVFNTTTDVASIYGSSITPNVIFALGDLAESAHLDQSATSGNNFASTGTIGSGGSTMITFTPGYTTPPVCTATDTHAANPVRVATSASSVTVYGTVGDTFAYICIGNPN
jgi:hypothetical protein